MLGGRSGELGVTVLVTAVAECVMPSVSVAGGPLVLEKWELLRHPLTWRAAGQPFPVVGHVRLVVVAARHRGLRQARRPARTHEPAGPPGAQDAGRRLGGKGDI